jgi:hypothetical protein
MRGYAFDDQSIRVSTFWGVYDLPVHFFFKVLSLSRKTNSVVFMSLRSEHSDTSEVPLLASTGFDRNFKYSHKMFSWVFKHTYNIVGDDDDESQQAVEKGPLAHERHSDNPRRVITILPWVLTVVFAAFSMVQYSERVRMSNLLASTSKLGWETEFCGYQFCKTFESRAFAEQFT